MNRSLHDPRALPARLRVLALLAASLLAGCETTGEAGKPGEPAKVEPPMTRTRAATECWMNTEKGGASINLDKRADIVSKCIDDKMKTAPAPKS